MKFKTLKFCPGEKFFKDSDENLAKAPYQSLSKLLPYPQHTLYKILALSKCSNKFSLITAIYQNIEEMGLDLNSGGAILEIGANLNPQKGDTDTTQFYDEPQNYILYYNRPEVSVNFLINQFNKAPGVDAGGLENHIITLNQNMDLTLDLMTINTRKFVRDKVHELLNLCFTNGNGQYYYFIVHRGKAHGLTLKTIIHWFYYGRKAGTQCDSTYMANVIDSKTVLKKSVDITHSKYKNSEYRSLSSIFELTKLYATQNDYYRLFTKNCQHFATGFFNLISGQDTSTSNFNYGKNIPTMQTLLEGHNPVEILPDEKIKEEGD